MYPEARETKGPETIKEPWRRLEGEAAELRWEWSGDLFSVNSYTMLEAVVSKT